MSSYAFAVPILPGKTGAVQRLAQELSGPRRSEFDEHQRRLGLTGEWWWLQPMPQQDLLLVHFQTGDPARVFRELAVSEHPFDRWFKQQLQDLFGLDLAQMPPGPMNERIFEWQ